MRRDRFFNWPASVLGHYSHAKPKASPLAWSHLRYRRSDCGPFGALHHCRLRTTLESVEHGDDGQLVAADNAYCMVGGVAARNCGPSTLDCAKLLLHVYLRSHAVHSRCDLSRNGLCVDDRTLLGYY